MNGAGPADPLRAVHSPDGPRGWHTGAELVDIVLAVCVKPIAAASGEDHAHHN
jgi:hypothetical protein